MIDLPPYSGESAVCPKCGHIGCGTAYRKAGDQRAGDFFAVPPGERAERLERHCPNCRYVWDEALARVPPPATDCDRLLRLLDDFGIEARHDQSCADHRERHVTLTAGDEIEGDGDLYALFVFDEETGKFKSAGVWCP